MRFEEADLIASSQEILMGNQSKVGYPVLPVETAGTPKPRL